MRLTLFDLDGTLLPIDSDHAFGEFMVRLGWADAQSFRQRNQHFFEQYQAGQLDIHAYVDFATQPWRERAALELAQASHRFMAEVVRPALRDSAFALVSEHAQAGDELVVVTATNDFITAPIAAALGVPNLIATELARDAMGRVSGAIHGAPAFRHGKVERVQQWLIARGRAREDFERITFYSDSTNDLALLEWATHAVATNPGPELARIAHERGWPIVKLFE